MENLYKILDCTETASFQELKKSFQALALQYHPDKSKSGHTCTEKFVKINRAWTILGDTRLRGEYDARWKERCLAQAYPIQDTVYFEEFEKLETDDTESGCCEPLTLVRKSSYKTDVINGDNYNTGMKKSNAGIHFVESCEGAEINTSASNDSSLKNDFSVSDRQTEDTAYVTGLPPLSEDDTVYTYDCRCGGSYVVTGVDVKFRFDIVCCDTCSLSVQVIYEEDKVEENL